MAAPPQSPVFVSHSSTTTDAARQVKTALEDAGFTAWLDYSDIQVGGLLRDELHDAIRQSRAVVLVWSAAAAQSRWVCAEVLTAFHLDRFIVPCVVDDTPLPQFLGSDVFVDLRKAGDGLRQVVRGVEIAPAHANRLPPLVAAPNPEVQATVADLYERQKLVTDPLTERDLAAAARAQAQLDPDMKRAEQRWRYELQILNLGGYHRKNGYMVEHWDAIQAGRPPRDPILYEGERLFFEAALVDPLDVSALNGLASILIFELELDAAAFFNARAIELSQKQSLLYDAALQDRDLIAWMKQQQRARAH